MANVPSTPIAIMNLSNDPTFTSMVKENASSYFQANNNLIVNLAKAQKVGFNANGQPMNNESMESAYLLMFAKSMGICDPQIGPDGLPSQETLDALKGSMRNADGSQYKLDSHWPQTKQGQLAGMAHEFMNAMSGTSKTGMCFTDKNTKVCSAKSPMKDLTGQDLMGKDYVVEAKKPTLRDRLKNPYAMSAYKRHIATPEYKKSREADKMAESLKANRMKQNQSTLKFGKAVEAMHMKRNLAAQKAAAKAAKAAKAAAKPGAAVQAGANKMATMPYKTPTLALAGHPMMKNVAEGVMKTFCENSFQNVTDLGMVSKMKLNPTTLDPVNKESQATSMLLKFAKQMNICDVKMGRDGLPTKETVDSLASAMKTATGQPFQLDSRFPNTKEGKLAAMSQGFAQAMTGLSKNGVAFESKDGSLCTATSPVASMTGKGIVGQNYCPLAQKPSAADRLNNPNAMRVYENHIKSPDYIASRNADKAVAFAKQNFAKQQIAIHKAGKDMKAQADKQQAAATKAPTNKAPKPMSARQAATAQQQPTVQHRSQDGRTM